MSENIFIVIFVSVMILLTVWGIFKPKDYIKIAPSGYKVFGVDTNNPPESFVTFIRVLLIFFFFFCLYFLYLAVKY